MELSEEHRLIEHSVREFAQSRIAPFAAEWDRKHQFPSNAIKEMGQLGLMGMLIPEAWGGSDAGPVALAIAIEEIAAADASCSTIMGVNNSVVCMPLLTYGSDAQKKRFLIPLASGEQLGCFCLTEPHAGSDAAHIQTRAVKQGDHYLLKGTKQFITSGKNADVAIVFASTDPSAGKKGISAFIVETQSEGYQVANIESKLGQLASDTAQIVLTDCKVKESQRLGKEGEGYKIALSNLEGGRIGIAAQSVGIARAALGAALQYAQERYAFGQPIIEQQSIAFKLADMATQLEAARLMTRQAALLKEQGKPCMKEACMAKLFASEAAEKICSDAIHIHGGYGYLNDFPVERYYRDVKVAQIYEGTSEIQRLVISRQIRV